MLEHFRKEVPVETDIRAQVGNGKDEADGAPQE